MAAGKAPGGGGDQIYAQACRLDCMSGFCINRSSTRRSRSMLQPPCQEVERCHVLTTDPSQADYSLSLRCKVAMIRATILQEDTPGTAIEFCGERVADG